MTAARPLARLLATQARAADPEHHAWVAASAGTGKTQVLVARVLRLLLAGVPASAILCITFTKLAAAEMQERVLQRLGFWARADEAALAADLAALGEPTDEPTRLRARRLFAQLLDSPQGLAVQTIHAFSQSLIASFPVEAGVAPGFQTLDDRAGLALRRDLLRSAIETADADADTDFLADVAMLSRQGGEGRLTAILASLGRHAEALAALRNVALEPMLRRGFGLPTDIDAAADLATMVAQHGLNAGTERLLASWRRFANSTAADCGGKAAAWLADPGSAEKLCALYLTGKGEPRKVAVVAAQEKAEPGLKDHFAAMAEAACAIDARQRLHAAVANAARQLRVARRLAADWIAAKARAGVIDYEDMISAARRLLTAPGAADWVRYKLDARIDHLLVDEAQDTNAAQWQIVDALAAEFFAGAGARGPGRRLFVVGDYKQAIFGFQGSDPRVYRDQRQHFEQLADDAGTPLEVVPLATNFRSVAAVLDVVDAVAAILPADA
ncbi:UvrD-helicase domain-containing protein, partial [Polymorphobacter multimanifer]